MLSDLLEIYPLSLASSSLLYHIERLCQSPYYKDDKDKGSAIHITLYNIQLTSSCKTHHLAKGDICIQVLLYKQTTSV